jgi:anti-anti-sigma factor
VFRVVTLTGIRGRTVAMRLEGELDLASWDAMDGALRTTAGGDVDVLVLDVAGLRFVDVRSVQRWLAAARALADRGGRLVLRDPSPLVRQLVRVLHRGEPVTIEPAPARIAAAASG